MISIRRRMMLLLGSAIALLLLGGGGLIFLTIRAVLTAQFDATLSAKAQALIVAADLDDGQLEIDLDLQEFAGFGGRGRGDYFQIFGPNRESLAKSPSLGRDQLPARASASAPEYDSIRLPDGRSGRAVWRFFQPTDDETVTPGKLQLVVATYSGGLKRSLRTIMQILFAVGLAGLIFTLFIVRFCLNFGLRPLDQLAEHVRGIGVSHLHQRLPTDPLPPELQPIAGKLNEMLGRLEEGFAREQRFSSHAAHELRTPLAELKVMIELVTRWPEEFSRQHGQEMLRAISESEALLDKLSLLSRAGERGNPLQRTPLALPDSVNASIERVRIAATERNLTLSTKIESRTVSTDPTLWSAILNNLLTNAVSHAPPGAKVLVEASDHHLAVCNEARDLDPEDIPHLFERFWRKSDSRSEKGHSGLGLSIVAACAEALGAKPLATLQNKRLRVEVAWDSAEKESNSPRPNSESRAAAAKCG